MKALIAAFFVTSFTFAGEPPSIPNGDFGTGKDGRPDTWVIRAEDAEISWHRDEELSSQVLSFAGRSNDSGVFLSQDLEGAIVHEGPTHLSAMVRTEDVARSAHLFVAVYGPNGRIFSDDMRGNPISGNSTWTRHSISIPQLANAQSVTVGAILFGKGNLSVDDFRINQDSIAESNGDIAANFTHLGTEFVELIESRYVFASRVNTEAIRSYLAANLPQAKNRQQAHAMLRTALAMLNEPHASFMEGRPKGDAAPDFSSEPGYSLSFSDDIARLSLNPVLSSMDEENFGQAVTQLERKITELEKQSIKGWVIDLRGFPGGSSWRLLDILQPFLIEGRLGGFQDQGGRKSWWRTEGNSVGIMEGEKYVSRSNQGTQTSPRIAPLRPVAVLIDGNTASAAESATVALKARKNTRTFGAPSAGLLTANTMIQLSDESVLVLPIGTTLDHQANEISRILPDTAVSGTQDALMLAIDWIKQDRM